MRVEIPAYCDRWMMGDRYGDVELLYYPDNGHGMAQVRLDKSQKVVKVVLGDCRVVE